MDNEVISHYVLHRVERAESSKCAEELNELWHLEKRRSALPYLKKGGVPCRICWQLPAPVPPCRGISHWQPMACTAQILQPVSILHVCYELLSSMKICFITFKHL